MSLEWVEYQQMTCDAPGCGSSKEIAGSRHWTAAAWDWTAVSYWPASDKHFCPAHKAEGEAAQRKATEVAHG